MMPSAPRRGPGDGTRGRVLRGDTQVGIRGIVVASEWDETGRPVRVSLHTRSEEEFILAPGTISKELLDHLTEEVVVCGFLAPSGDGRRVLRPLSYALFVD